MRTRMTNVVALALALAALLVGRDVFAQCGAKRSTCSACHDGSRAVAPSPDPWHADHAFANLCTTCHLGDGEAKEPAEAHANIIAAPLDAVGRCESCHGAATTSLLRGYRATAGSRRSDAGALAAAGGPSPPRGAAPDLRSRPAHGAWRANSILLAAIGAVAVAGLLILFRLERWGGRRPWSSRVARPENRRLAVGSTGRSPVRGPPTSPASVSASWSRFRWVGLGTA